MDYYSMNVKEVEGKLMTNTKVGLTTEESSKRLEQNGKNCMKEVKKKSKIAKFIAQFNDFMVIILLVAGGVSLSVSLINGENDFLDFFIIILIIFINATLGFIQENKAEKALEALKKMSTPMTKVIRNGTLQKIDSQNLVVGDLIVIDNGDYISADARLVESIGIKMEEATLTGESLPIEKITESIKEAKAIGDRKNMLYSSSLCVAGKGRAVVVGTGMNTEIGKIADMIMLEKTTQTNMQKKLSETGKILSLGALCICFIIFFIGLLRNIPPFEMLMTSISLAVAAIPEGLPAIVTVMLAIGVERMVKQNAIVRRLPAVEALGSATVICSDKTGTLTQNKMKIVKTVTKDKVLMCNCLAICNNVEIGENKKLMGEPTEISIMEFVMQRDVNKQKQEEMFPRIDEIPFTSSRKMMTTIHKYVDEYKVITKGAVDILINKCTYIYDGKKVQPLTVELKREVLKDNVDMAKDALRVIAVAYKNIKKYHSIKDTDIENDLIFVGMVGMIDPPRKEVIGAIQKCKEAGIKPVMITGDHIETAKAIGKKIGIMTTYGKAITGEQIDNMTEDEFNKKIYNYDVFARVSPEHKVKIVKTFKSHGEIVAMTGDGVNDAPALKSADIGCAMGITGTDVAKGASDIILIDDNFATIVQAIREGRGIYENIKKSVHFLLSSNIGEIITILIALLIGFPTPLVAIQLLWINLVTDSLPAIALGIDPPDKNIMIGKKIRPSKGIFTKERWIRIGLEGIMIGSIALIAYGIGIITFEDENIGSTMAFATLSISQLVHSFNMKTEGSIFRINFFNNYYLILAFIIGVVLQVGVIMVPVLANIFKVQPLNMAEWGVVSLLCIIPIIVVELEKLLGGKKIAIK